MTVGHITLLACQVFISGTLAEVLVKQRCLEAITCLYGFKKSTSYSSPVFSILSVFCLLFFYAVFSFYYLKGMINDHVTIFLCAKIHRYDNTTLAGVQAI